MGFGEWARFQHVKKEKCDYSSSIKMSGETYNKKVNGLNEDTGEIRFSFLFFFFLE